MPPKAGHTLPPSRRIRQRAEFERALGADSLANKWFSVYLRKNEYGLTRLGIIVSKRTDSKAVSRNFAKRMIREVFRCDIAIDFPLDIVVRAKRQIRPETAVEGRLALIHLFGAIQK